MLGIVCRKTSGGGYFLNVILYTVIALIVIYIIWWLVELIKPIVTYESNKTRDWQFTDKIQAEKQAYEALPNRWIETPEQEEERKKAYIDTYGYSRYLQFYNYYGEKMHFELFAYDSLFYEEPPKLIKGEVIVEVPLNTKAFEEKAYRQLEEQPKLYTIVPALKMLQDNKKDIKFAYTEFERAIKDALQRQFGSEGDSLYYGSKQYSILKTACAEYEEQVEKMTYTPTNKRRGRFDY